MHTRLSIRPLEGSPHLIKPAGETENDPLRVIFYFLRSNRSYGYHYATRLWWKHMARWSKTISQPREHRGVLYSLTAQDFEEKENVLMMFTLHIPKCKIHKLGPNLLKKPNAYILHPSGHPPHRMHWNPFRKLTNWLHNVRETYVRQAADTLMFS